MNVRLKVNVISGGKNYPRDSIVDDAMLSERQKTEAHVSYDLENKAGFVLVLHNLSFQGVPKPDSNGIPTRYPVWVMAGQTLELAKLPPAYRESLKEGTDYKSEWTFAEQEQLQKAAADADRRQFEAEPVIQNI